MGTGEKYSAFRPRGEVEGGAILVAASHENKVKLRVDGLHIACTPSSPFFLNRLKDRQGVLWCVQYQSLLIIFSTLGVCIIPAVPFALPFDPQQTKVP